MPVSLIETLRQGGCYWKREQYDSPGHSLAIPNGTPFKIAIEGPQSHQFTAGKCRDGHFVLDEGEHAGARFNSANEVVNIVRVPSSNAFLYLHFHIGGRWTLADDLRRSEESRFDDVEEVALEEALYVIRRHPKGKTLDHVEAVRHAADLVAKRPAMIDIARDIARLRSDVDLSELI